MFLRTAEMEEYINEIDGPVPPGAQLNVNHLDCDAGTDTKARLYIKRAPDGWLFYCQHCNKKGYYRLKDFLYRAMEVRPEPSHDKNDKALLSALGERYLLPFKHWPPEARLWWQSYELNEAEADALGVQWVPSYCRLFMPAGGTWVGRGFGTSRRYVSYKQSNTVPLFAGYPDAHQLVVVEDIVSAYKVAKAGYNVLALLGTTASNFDIDAMLPYNRIVLWFDSDVAGRKASATLSTKIFWTSNVVSFVYGQPKETPLYKIKEMLSA